MGLPVLSQKLDLYANYHVTGLSLVIQSTISNRFGGSEAADVPASFIFPEPVTYMVRLVL